MPARTRPTVHATVGNEIFVFHSFPLVRTYYYIPNTSVSNVAFISHLWLILAIFLVYVLY